MKHPYIMCALALYASLILAGAGYAQTTPPAIRWQRSYGGSNYDAAYSIQQTSDGTYIIGGASNSTDFDVTGNHGNNDYWILKLDPSGSILWKKSYGGTENDNAYCVRQTSDLGYIVAGSTSSSNSGDVPASHGGDDYWIVKLDGAGTIQWSKCYGGTGDDDPYSISQTSDGGYIIAGETTTDNNGDVTGYHGNITGIGDYWVVKIDASGNLQWQKTLGGGGTDQAKSVQQTSDGGYIVAGISSSNDGDVSGNHGGSDCWIVKLDGSGNIQWQRSLGGSGNDGANCIRQTTDGGYIVAGYSNSSDGDATGNHGGDDYWVIKLDGNGNIVWENSYGGSGDDEASSVGQTSDNGYIVTGFTSSLDGEVTGFHGVQDYWLIKLDPAGTLQWEKSLGGSGGDEAQSVEQTTDTGYIVAGFSTSNDLDVTGNHGGYDYWIVKLDQPPVIASIVRDSFAYVLCKPASYDTLWVHDTGAATLVLSSAAFGSSSQDFSLVAPVTFPVYINPGDSVQFIIQFTPTTSGLIADTLSIVNNDPAPGHNPWQIYFAGTRDSIAFSTQGSIAGDSLDFGEIACGTTKDTTFTIINLSSIPTTFTIRSGDTAEFTFSQNTIYIDIATQRQIGVHFAGGMPGVYITPLIITDTCGKTQTVYLKAKVDSSLFAVTSLSDTAICPPEVLTRFVTIHNFSRITQNLDLHGTGDTLYFNLIPNSFTLTPGDSAILQLTFENSHDTGTFTVSYPLPGCNGTQAIMETVIVDSTRLSAQSIPDTTVCTGEPAVRYFTIHNLRNQPQEAQLWDNTSADTLFTFVPDSVLLGADDSATVRIVFRGTTTNGIHTLSFVLVDACGGGYNFSANVGVGSSSVTAQAIPDTTVCQGDSLLRFITLYNNTSLSQYLRLSGNAVFSFTPDTVTIAGNDSAKVALMFRGTNGTGRYTLRYQLPGCDTTQAIAATVIVDSLNIATEAIPDTTVCPGDSTVRFLTIRNLRNQPQSTQILLNDSLFSAAPDTLTLGANGSATVQITFRGTTTSGTYTALYSIVGACNAGAGYTTTVNVSAAGVKALAVGDTSVCPGDSAVRHITLHNVSTVFQQLILPNAPLFSFSPDTLTLAAGDSATVTLTFLGAADTGMYTENFPLPGCGGANAITASVRVKTPNIAVPQTLSETVCPNTPVAVKFPVTNSDTITHILTFTDSNCTLSQTTATLAAGATDTLAATFAGGAAGTYTCTVHVMDDCGGVHVVTLTISVQSLPPLALALVPDATPVKVGGEVKIYVTATPPSSVAGTLSFTVGNDAQILRFDSVHTSCGSISKTSPGSTVITLGNCPALASDTIATLYYEALAGPTLTTSAEIVTAATTNACQTVSASGAAMLTLLPPSCDIGTIGIEPQATSLGAVYPNPATGAVTIAYTMVEDAPVRIALADALGRTVATLVDGWQKHGSYLAEFDAHGLPNGAYVITMQEGLYKGAREMFVVK